MRFLCLLWFLFYFCSLTFDGAAPAASVCPLGSVTDTKIPPGSPFMNGRPTTLTLSPALTVLAFQPLRTRYAGGFISKLHRSVPPLLLGTCTSSHEWGLPHLNALTVPSTTTVFVRSIPAAEWCANTVPVISRAAVTNIDINKPLMVIALRFSL